MIDRAFIICGVLLLAGCASQAAGYAESAEKELKAFNDVRAQTYSQLPCAIPLGAFERMEDRGKQGAVACLCMPGFVIQTGGQCNAP